MEIKCKYKLSNSESINTIVLDGSEYYEPLLVGENLEDDAIPKYNDTRDYVSGVENELFEWCELIISGTIKNDTVIRTEYYAKGKSELTCRKDFDGYELIIQSFLIRSNEVYISRMERTGLNEPWVNTDFSLGVNFEGGSDEMWYNLKEGEKKV